MDKQLDACDSWIVDTYVTSTDHPNTLTKQEWELLREAWQAAQAVMSPEIDYLKSYIDGQDDSFATMMKQLSAANQRITELLDLVEVVERRNKQLEERIRVADAEEPFCYKYRHHSMWGGTVLLDDPTYDGQDALETIALYLHAQIPAEVELKAKIAELEAIIKASQKQDPVAYVDSKQLRRWDVLRGTDYESPERCYMPWSRDRFKTDLTNCDFPVYAAPVIKEQYKVVFYINPDDLVVDKADKKYVTDIPCDGCTEALFIKEQLCAHGRALNDYCEPCGRIHSA